MRFWIEFWLFSSTTQIYCLIMFRYRKMENDTHSFYGHTRPSITFSVIRLSVSRSYTCLVAISRITEFALTIRYAWSTDNLVVESSKDIEYFMQMILWIEFISDLNTVWNQKTYWTPIFWQIFIEKFHKCILKSSILHIMTLRIRLYFCVTSF